MADIADQAQEQTDLELKIALQNVRNKAPDLLFTGSCYYCDALIDSGNFCDKGCRDDYERKRK